MQGRTRLFGVHEDPQRLRQDSGDHVELLAGSRRNCGLATGQAVCQAQQLVQGEQTDSDQVSQVKRCVLLALREACVGSEVAVLGWCLVQRE